MLLDQISTSPLHLVGYSLAAIWLALSAYFIVLFVSRKWLLRNFNGAFAVPVLGNCYNVETLSFMRFLAQLRKTYGKVFTVFPFAKAYLVLCDPVVVRRVLSDTKTFIKGADYSDIFSLAFGQGLVTATGEKHLKDRAIFGKYFIKSSITKYVGMINATTKEAVETKLAKALEATDNRSMSINIEDFFATLALRVFLTFSLNTNFKDSPETESALCKVVSDGSWGVARMMSLNLPMWRIFYPVSYIIRAREQVLAACTVAVEQRRKLMANNECGDLDDPLTAMIREKMPEKDVLDHVMTLVCAGHDTTAYFSAFMVLLLAENPAAQDQLRKEIFDVVGNREDITMEDLSELKYLQKVMQETLRLYAVIPFVTREATEDVTIKEANITIPKGANVMVPFYLLNRDPAIWENPSVFNPDRFDGRTTEFTSAKNGFFPFGYGSRTCIGNTLAQTENGIFICHILRKFQFTALPGFKPAIYGGISLTTSNGVHVVIKPL